MRRPLTHVEALAAWRVDAELSDGHSPSQTIGFISALEDIAEQSRPLPSNVILADCEPKWRTKLGRWFRPMTGR